MQHDSAGKACVADGQVDIVDAEPRGHSNFYVQFVLTMAVEQLLMGHCLLLLECHFFLDRAAAWSAPTRTRGMAWHGTRCMAGHLRHVCKQVPLTMQVLEEVWHCALGQTTTQRAFLCATQAAPEQPSLGVSQLHRIRVAADI